MNPLVNNSSQQQQHGIIMYSNGNNIHHRPVCCAMIPSSFGVPLVLTSWIGLGLYFSVLAFMGKSPFYSHFQRETVIVFGVLNVIFVIVCSFGYSLHLVKRSVHRYRQYAKLLACCMATILLDMLINFIIFCLNKTEFQTWCHDTALHNLQAVQNGTAIAVLDQSIIAQQPDIINFNCWRMFTLEAEFSVACLVLMVMVYVYWAKFIIQVSRNFVLIRPEIHRAPPDQIVQQSVPTIIHPVIDASVEETGGIVTVPMVNQSELLA